MGIKPFFYGWLFYFSAIIHPRGWRIVMESFMKKLLLIFLVLVVAGGAVFAFDPLSYPPPVGGGNILVDAGAGFWYTNWSTTNGKLSIPPLFVNVEYALPVQFPISVGGGISFFQWKYDYAQIRQNHTLTWVTPQARASWHWGFDASKLDFYTGISLGWNIVAPKYGDEYWATLYTPEAKSSPYWGAHVGAHFYFNDRVGAMVEAGYPFLIKGGLALKFGEQKSGSGTAARGRGTASVTTDVNLRSGPSLDFPVIIALRQGAVVTLTGEIIEGWTQVIYNGQTGWISSPYLTTVR